MIQKKSSLAALLSVLTSPHLVNQFWPREIQQMRAVKSGRLTYLGYVDLLDILSEVHRIEANHYSGIFIEAGTALGGSAIVIATSKKKDRRFLVYDAFEMIPPPSENDGKDAVDRYQVIKSGKADGLGGNGYYGYEENLIDTVQKSFDEHGVSLPENHVSLIKGYFEKTLTVSEPVAFAHIDCDWFNSVMVCLAAIIPNLVVGGSVVINDYFDWSGCTRAVDQYFEDKHSEFAFDVKSRLHITRVRATP